MIPSRYRGIENTQTEINTVLDKIRAEIDKELFTYSQEVENMGDSAQKIRISLGIVRKIIDKYRKEQE